MPNPTTAAVLKAALDCGEAAHRPKGVSWYGLMCEQCADAYAHQQVEVALAAQHLQDDLTKLLPGQRCVRPDHNGGDGRQYGYMCGGCAFELAQDEAREQVEAFRERAAGIAESHQLAPHEIAAAIRALTEGRG